MTTKDAYAGRLDLFQDTVEGVQKIVREGYHPAAQKTVPPCTPDQLKHQAEILQHHRNVLFFLGKDAPAPDMPDKRHENVTTRGAELWHWGYSTYWYEQRRVFFSDHPFYDREGAIANWTKTLEILAFKLEQDRIYAEAWHQEFNS